MKIDFDHYDNNFLSLKYSFTDEVTWVSNILSPWKTLANLPSINHIAKVLHTVQILLKSSFELIFSFYSLSTWKFSWIPFSEGVWFRLKELGSPYRGDSLFASPMKISLLAYFSRKSIQINIPSSKKKNYLEIQSSIESQFNFSN